MNLLASEGRSQEINTIGVALQKFFVHVSEREVLWWAVITIRRGSTMVLQFSNLAYMVETGDGRERHWRRETTSIACYFRVQLGRQFSFMELGLILSLIGGPWCIYSSTKISPKREDSRKMVANILSLITLLIFLIYINWLHLIHLK